METTTINLLITFAVGCVVLGNSVVIYYTKQSVNQLHVDVNSRLTQLLIATSNAAHAEGILAGKQSRKEEAKTSEPTKEEK